jgi:TrmH family RNA methyltransferase
MPVQPEIQPLSQAKRKIIADLATRHGRERRGLFRLEGPRAIEDAIARGARFRCLVVNEDGAPWVERWAQAGLVGDGVEVYRAPGAELDGLADTATTQGVVAIGDLPSQGVADLPADLGRLVLLADSVQDPGNLGTLFRTLVAVGGRTAILCRGTVDPFNPKALRGAAGATFDLAIAAGLDRGAAIDLLTERGIAVVAMATGMPSLFEASIPQGPLALAVGNEGAGLGAEIQDRAALVVGLPMAPAVESLSAAVAGSIAMYALAYRLRSGGPE